MEQGRTGLEEFRQSRIEELLPGIDTSYFFVIEGKIKPSVQQHIADIHDTSSINIRDIILATTKTLDPNPKTRASISQVRVGLSASSSRYLLSAVLNHLMKYLDLLNTSVLQDAKTMSIWFQTERLRALKQILTIELADELQIFKDVKAYNEFHGIMIEIFEKVDHELHTPVEKSHYNIVQEKFTLLGSTEDQIQAWVDKVWNMVPDYLSRKAQAMWLQTMQEDNLQILNDIQEYSQSHHTNQYMNSDMSALTRMKAIRVQMDQNLNTGASEFKHECSDLEDESIINGQHYGIFKKTRRVLVEWQYYRPEWANISDKQRVTLMELRAKDFNIDPKPDGLRI
jgi:hypothetical protein